MRNITKLLISILLILSLVFGATSCEYLFEYEHGSGAIDKNDKETPDKGEGSGDDVIGDNGNSDTENGENNGGQGSDGSETEDGPGTDNGGNNGNQGSDNPGTEDGTGTDNGETKPDPEPKPDLFAGGIFYLPNEEDPVTSDPYTDVDVEEFYANYTPAVSYMDAYYRTQHNLMSGSIDEQDQAPTVSSYQPMIDGIYLRNYTYIFSEDGNTYYVVNAYGEIVNEIYKGGAYVILEEVAAYVFAFSEPPVNHSSSKKTRPTESPWGIYLRVNHTRFTGDTSRYPYEPELPNISGCGGDLNYWEMDIGTTGTDCDPKYDAVIYNDGYRIERGAARIVYARYDLNGNGEIEVDETYLFYTYNHYNDFQEYLNYEGGWGEMFGNITGGGTISSKKNYNPTPYVETLYTSLIYEDGTAVGSRDTNTVVMVFLPWRKEA